VSTILIVEDNPLTQDLLCDMLESHGFKVLSANDGIMGLHKVKEQLPDLIISDLQMPRLNGLELLHVLQQDPITAAIPFIVCTSETSRNMHHMALNQGASAFLNKPFDLARLIRIITAQLERKSSSLGSA
jgi:CheY-like chemotaxis protein